MAGGRGSSTAPGQNGRPPDEPGPTNAKSRADRPSSSWSLIVVTTKEPVNGDSLHRGGYQTDPRQVKNISSGLGEAAERVRYPEGSTEARAFLENRVAAWTTGETFDAIELLEALDNPIRDVIATIISGFGVPSTSALEILRNVGTMSARRQWEIVALYRSGRPEAMSLAITRAISLPPLPWGALPWADKANLALEKLAKSTRGNPDLHDLADEAERLHADVEVLMKLIEKRWRAFRKNELKALIGGDR